MRQSHLGAGLSIIEPGRAVRFLEQARQQQLFGGIHGIDRQDADHVSAARFLLLAHGSASLRRAGRGAQEFAGIPEIPPDPYDIVAGVAQNAMRFYDLPLSPGEQQVYQYGMNNSEERGPCCCQCWRWRVYGGLARFLIRKHRFTGEQLVEVWNLSSGCGGGDEHLHG
jgi:hypothetical protein